MTKLPFLVALEAKQSKYGLKLIIPIKIKIVTIIKVGESKSLKCKKNIWAMEYNVTSKAMDLSEIPKQKIL